MKIAQWLEIIGLKVVLISDHTRIFKFYYRLVEPDVIDLYYRVDSPSLCLQ